MSKPRQYVLGLDLGVSSLGWGVIELQGSGDNRRPVGLVDTGVRIFEAGVEGGIEQGKDSSRGAKRRQARQPRRQQWRRQNRKRKVFALLQRLGLLPPSMGNGPLDRKALLDELDATLREKHLREADLLAHHKLPYLLRAMAAESPVPDYELGRALYHLAQRRGYLSNRKGDADDDEEKGKVATGIADNEAAAEGKTLGQFFARDVDVFDLRLESATQRIDPKTGRIRRRYLGRHQYHEEFNTIRAAQQRDPAAHPQLTDAAWDDLYNAIYFQRPLKSQKHLIGRCTLEPKRRRCPEVLPVFQEFRILQAVNHLRVRMPNYAERELNEEERTRLIEALQTVGEMSLKSTAKKAAGLPKGEEFTLEEWEDKLVGHRTNQKMIGSFGDRWLTVP